MQANVLEGRAKNAIDFIANIKGFAPSLQNFVTAVTVKNASIA
ncbi:hypothetical protein [Polaromonas sp. CG9_12]|nr:hypothetical protein [Polaromonas sp. CG9_12]